MGIFQQFPYSNFHEFNLDQIIKILREMQDEWTATKTEWTSYKEFIDNYFENLDVSEEVLAALRIFASDGTLNQIMDPTIASETATWLAEHITQPTTPAVDTSLTIAGAAADAQAVGGVRDNVVEALNNSNFIINENVTAGSNYDSTIYLLKDVKYTLKLNTSIASYIGCYVYGDSANAVYLSNNAPTREYTPAVSGFLRLFPNQYTGMLNVAINNELNTRMAIMSEDIRHLQNSDGRSATYNWIAADNYDTDIYLNAGQEYKIYCNEFISSSYISCYIPGDNSNTLTLNKSHMTGHFTPNISGYLRLYSPAAIGSHSFTVKTLAELNSAPMEYTVGAGETFDSLVKLLIGLTFDVDPKIINIMAGTYDIYNEYKACITAGYLTNPVDTSQYFYPYNALVTDKTILQGHGDVTLLFMPEDADVTVTQMDTWAPLTVYGGVTIRNINIEGQNCRYLIHDDDHTDYPNTEHVYENVNLIMHHTTKTASSNFYAVTGFGFTPGGTYIFNNCKWYRDGAANRGIFYGHNTTDGASANIVCNNCIFNSEFTNTNAFRLQTLSHGSAKRVLVRIASSFINGKIRKDIINADGINPFDVTCLYSGAPEVQYSGNGAGNPDPYDVEYIQ